MNQIKRDSPLRAEARFSRKTWGDHVIAFFSKPSGILFPAITVFGIFWTFGEASIHFLEADARGAWSFGYLIVASLIAGIAWRFYHYLHAVPEGLENTPRNAQKYAHWQRPLWEYRLAKVLLAERLGPHDRELRNLLSGRSFVISEPTISHAAYVDWALARTENVMRMLGVAKLLLLQDYPHSLFSTAEAAAEPRTILEETDKLARFYGETVEFEKQGRAVSPPDGFESLHALQDGWSEPIRDAIHQLFVFLQRMTEVDPSADNYVKFAIIFAEVPNLQEFCNELDRLQQRLR